MHLRPDRAEATPEAVGEDPVAPRRRRRPGRILVVVVLLVAVAGVVLAVLARPLLNAKHEADAAQADLKQAKAQLSQQQLAQARASIADARAHVDAAHADAHGFGASVWSVVPVARGAVADERHLVDALGETTSVAELGAELYPMVSGHGSHLVNGQRVDLPVLRSVVARTEQIGRHLDAAMADVNAVRGTTPFVGGAVTRAKTSALGYLEPVQASYTKAGPLVQSLPGIVGANGPRTYLIAMLNPAELRYSGGGALSFTTLRFDHGAATFGTSVNVDDLLARGTTQHWKPIPGNPFYRGGPLRVTSSTFSPWWSVSSENLLRAYQAAYPGQRLDGVIGLDLQSLADVFRVTGPVDLAHFGTINADNLVRTLAGSYGDFASVEVRHQLNEELIPAFRQQFFEGGRMADKMKALVDSAEGRHFFTYFRDRSTQRRFAAVGLSGDLSRTPYDYLGVFTQNLNGSKVDYWQHRALDSTVQLRADGSAAVRLKVDVTNAAPAYSLPTPDPRKGYDTRYLDTLVAVFLPHLAHLGTTTVDGTPVRPFMRHPHVHGVVNRRFFDVHSTLNSGEHVVVGTRYVVPTASVRNADGTMTYHLDVDPQDTVVPETLHLTVVWPQGWHPTSLPTGWVSTGSDRAELTTPVTRTLSYAVPLAPN